jgi:hypothetical protein
MGAYAPDETVAQVRALALAGYSGPAIAQRTNIPVRTVQHWLAEWRELAPEQSQELANAELRIARRMDAITESFLDRVEAGQEKLSGVATFTMWGISRSKIHERAQRSNPVPQGNTYVFMQAPPDAAAQLRQAHSDTAARSGMELTPTFVEPKGEALDNEAD